MRRPPPFLRGSVHPNSVLELTKTESGWGGVVTGRQSGRTSTRLCTLDDVIRNCNRALSVSACMRAVHGTSKQPKTGGIVRKKTLMGCTRNLEATKDRWDREEEDTDGLYAEPCDGVRQLGTPSGSSQKLMKCRWECISYRVVSYHAPRPQHGYGNGTGCLYTLFLSP